MSRLLKLFEIKGRVLEELSGKLSPESKLRASCDHHSRRRPRPCGMTIHSGIGCSYLCAYCYIYDMGFPAKPKPYPLRSEEMTYALALNPYVIPERTLAAYGSVTEPFLPETAEYTIKCMREVYRWLKLPTQVSTKAILTEELLSGISSGDPKTSILVTAVTLSNRRIEPRAPDPAERIRSVGKASKIGLMASLFMRPIIPGITDAEAERILGLAVESGIKSVVLGSLRITGRILKSLRHRGANVDEIKRRLTKPLSGSEQIEIKSADLKGRVKRIAEDLGLTVFRTACEANVYAHGRRCTICDMGPCNMSGKLEPIESCDIKDLLEYLGIRYIDVSVTDNMIKVTLKEKGDNGRLRHIMAAATYRKTILKHI